MVAMAVDGQYARSLLAGFPVAGDQQVDRYAVQAGGFQQQFVASVVGQLDASFLFDLELPGRLAGSEQTLERVAKFLLPVEALFAGGPVKEHRQTSSTGRGADCVGDTVGVRWCLRQYSRCGQQRCGKCGQQVAAGDGHAGKLQGLALPPVAGCLSPYPIQDCQE